MDAGAVVDGTALGVAGAGEWRGLGECEGLADRVGLGDLVGLGDRVGLAVDGGRVEAGRVEAGVPAGWVDPADGVSGRTRT